MTNEEKQRFSDLMQRPAIHLTDEERIEMINLGARVLLEMPLDKRYEEYSKMMRQITREFPVMRT